MADSQLSDTDLRTIRESFKLASTLLRHLISTAAREKTPGASAVYRRWERRIKDASRRLPHDTAR